MIPLIVILSAVGAYAIQNNPVHIYWTLAFGVTGYFFKKYGFQTAPIILGVILGPIMDVNYRRAMIDARDASGQFVLDFLINPISLVLSTALLLLILSQTPALQWAKALRKRHGWR